MEFLIDYFMNALFPYMLLLPNAMIT